MTSRTPNSGGGLCLKWGKIAPIFNTMEDALIEADVSNLNMGDVIDAPPVQRSA